MWGLSVKLVFIVMFTWQKLSSKSYAAFYIFGHSPFLRPDFECTVLRIPFVIPCSCLFYKTLKKPELLLVAPQATQATFHVLHISMKHMRSENLAENLTIAVCGNPNLYEIPKKIIPGIGKDPICQRRCSTDVDLAIFREWIALKVQGEI